MNQLLSYHLRKLSLLLMVLMFSSTIFAQDIDGLVLQPELLTGQDVSLQPVKGPTVDGKLIAILPSKRGLADVSFFEVESSGRTKKIRADQIASLKIGGNPMMVRPNPVSKLNQLIDLNLADGAVDARLKKIGKARRPVMTDEEFATLTRKSLEFAKDAVKKLEGGLYVVEGEEVILITDFPQQQSKGLLRTVDQMIPTLKSVFGVGLKSNALPGKPVVCAFGVRQNLASFQTEIAKYTSYGDIKAFFQMIDGNIVISAEDGRSPQHMLWQAAWGLSGAFSTFCYTDAELPLWVKVGVQQHCGDLLVRGITDHGHELKIVQGELRGGALNGIMFAENLPGERQLICKLLVAHLYKVNSAAFGQMLELLKQGRNTDEVLKQCYGINQQVLASSFGKAISIPELTP